MLQVNHHGLLCQWWSNQHLWLLDVPLVLQAPCWFHVHQESIELGLAKAGHTFPLCFPLFVSPISCLALQWELEYGGQSGFFHGDGGREDGIESKESLDPTVFPILICWLLATLFILPIKWRWAKHKKLKCYVSSLHHNKYKDMMAVGT